jgi:hypothetical protein
MEEKEEKTEWQCLGEHEIAQENTRRGRKIQRFKRFGAPGTQEPLLYRYLPQL